MPKMRKLSVDEVKTIERKTKGQRKVVEEQYDAFLTDYALGDYGEAELEEGEKRITVRNRLKAAALRQGVGLAFRRTKGDTLRFHIVSPDSVIDSDEDDDDDDFASAMSPAVVVPISSDEPPKEPKRRGRRKKSEMV